MLSKWCQAVGLEWVMGVRSPSVVHDMTGAAGVQVKWTAFWQRAEEPDVAARLQPQKTTHVRGIVFAILRAFMCVEHHTICDEGVVWKSIWNRCLWFPPPCTNDVLWVIRNVFTLVAFTACYDQFHFQSLFESQADIHWGQDEQKILKSWKNSKKNIGWEVMEKKEEEEQKVNNNRQREQSVYLWQPVQQSLRPRSPWGIEWHSGKGLGPFVGRCLAGRIPQSAGNSGVWQKPRSKCPHCVSGKQERTGSEKTGRVIMALSSSLCLSHSHINTSISHLTQCFTDTQIHKQRQKNSTETSRSLFMTQTLDESHSKWLFLWWKGAVNMFIASATK